MNKIKYGKDLNYRTKNLVYRFSFFYLVTCHSEN